MKILLIYLWFFTPLFQAPPDDGWAAIADWMAAYLNDLIIEGMKAVATTFWYLEKVAAGITRFLTEQDMWELILDSTLGSIRETMPDILSGLIFSNNGAGGLLYLALFMAGLLMIIPNMSHIRLVDPTRVITWAIIISVLFLSAASPWGYDLIGLVEQMRAGAVQVVIDTAAEEGNLDALVAQPMMAEDTDLENYSFVLSEEFEEEYYPEPEDDDYEERTVTFIESPFFTWAMTFEVESEDSQNERREKAETGLAISGLTLMPGMVLLMFGFIFATLTASALILILFFLVSLPLGFFEFGAAILNGIVKQYAYLWAITLLAIVLPGILIAAETLAYPDSGPPAPEQIMAFIPILVVVTIATSYVSAMATSAMTDTFSMISTSISTSMAPLNYGGSMPQGGALGGGPVGGAVSGAASLVGTAALAAVTGGASAALMAGGGTLLSKVGGGETAGALATGLMGTERTSVFTTAARGRGAAQVAQAAGLQHRRRGARRERQKQENEKLKKSFTRTQVPQLSEGEVQMGAYTTFDATRLQPAEEAFREGKIETARAHLMDIFGKSEVSDAILASYQQGPEGVRRVRQMVGYAQGEARRMTLGGIHLFDEKGRINETAQGQIWERYRATGTIQHANKEQTQLAALLMNASIRPTPTLWREQDMNHQLADAILNRPEDSHPHIEDASAAYALYDMAQSQAWSQGQIASLFSATKEAQALNEGENNYGSVAKRLRHHGEWANENRGMRREAARLATLIIGPNIPPQPRTTPNSQELAQKVANPQSEQVVTTNQGAPIAIEQLHQLGVAQGWAEPELTTLFETTRAALQTSRRPSETYVDIAARNLAATPHFLNTDENTRRQAARLALQTSYGTTLTPEEQTSAPSGAPRGANQAPSGTPRGANQAPSGTPRGANQAQAPTGANAPRAANQAPRGANQAPTQMPTGANQVVIEAPEWLDQAPLPDWDEPPPQQEWDGAPEDQEWHGPPEGQYWDEPPTPPEWNELPPQPEWDGPPEEQEWYGPPEEQGWHGPPEGREGPPEGREGPPEGQGVPEGP